MDNGSKARMVESAAALIGARGLNAASFAEVLAASGAPRGSIYHHFPDGKRELAEAAMRWTSGRVLDWQRRCAAGDAAGVMAHFVAMWRAALAGSGCTAGCAVAGVLMDTGTADPVLGETARAALRAWSSLLAEQFSARGVAEGRAATLALATVAAVEGAALLCRAEGSTEPLDAVAEELARLAAASLISAP